MTHKPNLRTNSGVRMVEDGRGGVCVCGCGCKRKKGEELTHDKRVFCCGGGKKGRLDARGGEGTITTAESEARESRVTTE